MNRVIDNLINGNLSDAKQLAKSYAGTALIGWIHDNTNWTSEKALKAVQYLKGDGSFQAYCDAK